MKIKDIRITRRSYHTAGEPEFSADVTLVGGSAYPADIKIQVPEALLLPIVAIVAQAIADTMARSTTEFHDEVQAMLAGPAIDQTKLADGNTVNPEVEPTL